jgi:magnesium-transporting ATPase (P-type)
LTENEMTVRELWTLGGDYTLIGAAYDLDGMLEKRRSDGDESDAVELLRIAALCCDAHLADDSDAQEEPQKPAHLKTRAIGDPTEAAIIVAAAKAGLSHDSLKAWPRLAELPFDSTRKRMTTIQRIEGVPVACVKGAPSEIFPRCTAVLGNGRVLGFDSHYRREAQAAHDEMAERGMRVLAVARRLVDEPIGTDGWRVEDVERDLTLLGLVAMEDPPRKEVPAAIAACRNANVRVVMVTGDNGLTAAAIGREIGLHQGEPQIVNGVELDEVSDEQLDCLIEKNHLLFARVSPEHKLRLVEAYQRKREVVAVTGDGVNDAPALKRADIGIAMGETGTDVAREAADIVLTDDNFASIIAAIEEGRGVYDNVRKFVTYIFASNIPELVPFIAFVLFRIPLPLTVMQILAVDLGTDMVPALALGAEPPESNVMQRSPRSREDRLLNFVTLLRAYGWLGLLEAAFSLAGFFFVYWLAGWRPGGAMASSGTLYATATTMTLAGIVACQVGNVFACRSSTQSIFKLVISGNRLLLLGIAVELGLLLLLIYAPTVAGVFGLAPLGLEHWAILAAFAPLLLITEEARKALVRAKTS